MDQRNIDLSSSMGVFHDIPLSGVTCSLGARFCESDQTIICSEGFQGFAISSPLVDVDPGFYAVEIDISVSAARNPRLRIELCYQNIVLTERAAILERSTLLLRTRVPHKSQLEIRVNTEYTGFIIYGIRIKRTLGLADDGIRLTSANRTARIHRLQSAIGFSKDLPKQGESSANDILSEILSDEAFLWLDNWNIPKHGQALIRSGIDICSVEHFFELNNQFSFVPGANESELMRGYPYISNSFQMDIIDNKSLKIPSPFGEGFIESNVSFPIQDEKFKIAGILYEFSDPHHLVVGTGISWNGAISFYWFVDQNILIYSRYVEQMGEWRPTLNVIRAYVQLCEKWRAKAFRYRGAKKTIACYCSPNFNLGHAIWNDISGMERVIRSEKSIPFIIGPTSHFDIAHLFEFDNIDIIPYNVVYANDIFRITIENSYFVVRPTGTAVDFALAEKIRKSAMRKTEITGLAGPAIPEETDFVLFYNIRSHNKVWREQVSGAGELVRRLRDELGFNSITLFLDGFGDCSNVVLDISKEVEGLCRVVDGTNISLSETILWAYRCDFYVAVIGSGLTLLTWLAAKPGICHGDQGHLDQMSWWHSVRADSILPLFPRLDQFSNIEDKYYSDYTMQPSVLSNLMVEYMLKKKGGGLGAGES